MKTAFLSLLLASIVAGLVLACNAQVAQVLESEDAATQPAPDGGNGDDGTIVTDASFGPAFPDANDPVPDSGKFTCTKDYECNDDLTMSSIAGQCWNGMCICNGGDYHIQPNGKCGTKEPPSCAQQGGTCQPLGGCGQGKLEAFIYTSMACSDASPMRCCIPTTSCYAPVDIVCCGASVNYYEPTCVNGWKTCEGGGPLPRLRSQGCP